MASLPTPRQLLTSLMNSISKIPVEQNERRSAYDKPSNSLHRIDSSYRPLMTTLHVLFPSLLLPALDLLDRGLVTRVILDRTQLTEKHQERTSEMQDAVLEDKEVTEGEEQAPARPKPPAPFFYLVRSTAPSSRRNYGATTTTGGQSIPAAAPAGGQTYVVHVGAWNCTCAGFAFAAFPVSGTDLSTPVVGASAAASSAHERGGGAEPEALVGGENVGAVEGGGAETEWQFGGVSGVGVPGEDTGDGVPCCKHLLACVLAERWEAALGRYVVERRVRREEMAGIVADV